MPFENEHIAAQEAIEVSAKPKPKFPGVMKVGMSHAPGAGYAQELQDDLREMLGGTVTGVIAPRQV